MKKMTALAAAVALVLVSAPALHADDADAQATGAHIELVASPRIRIATPDSVEPTRPAALPALYASLAGLQAYDGYATLRGTSRGANETNPLVGGLAKQPAAFWTVKAASTLATVYFAEQLWRDHHRARAVWLMVAANGAMGAVAARNASVLSRR